MKEHITRSSVHMAFTYVHLQTFAWTIFNKHRLSYREKSNCIKEKKTQGDQERPILCKTSPLVRKQMYPDYDKKKLLVLFTCHYAHTKCHSVTDFLCLKYTATRV